MILDFSSYTDRANRPRIWVSLVVTDDEGNTAETTKLLHRTENNQAIQKYALLGDTFTNYLVS